MKLHNIFRRAKPKEQQPNDIRRESLCEADFSQAESRSSDCNADDKRNAGGSCNREEKSKKTTDDAIQYHVSGLLRFARNDLSKVTSGENVGTEHARKLIFFNFLITFYLEILKNYV